MSKPWQCLEEIRGLVAVPLEWRAWLGTDFDVFKAAFMRKRPGWADSTPCPREPGRAHVVVPRGDVFVAVCESGCPDMPLKREDVEMWEVNPSKLGRAICKAFDCDARVTDLRLPLTWQVGVKFANAVAVVLTIQNERKDFRNVVAELVARWRRSFILFAPTSRFVDGVCTELLDKADAGFFDLESHVILTAQGNLRPCKPPGELFAKFAPAAVEPVSGDVAQVMFAALKKLETGKRYRKAPVLQVLRLYCIEECSRNEVARRCNCAPSLITLRLKHIEATFKRPPAELRPYATQLEAASAALSDSRAKSIYRRGLTDDTGSSEEDE